MALFVWVWTKWKVNVDGVIINSPVVFTFIHNAERDNEFSLSVIVCCVMFSGTKMAECAVGHRNGTFHFCLAYKHFDISCYWIQTILYYVGHITVSCCVCTSWIEIIKRLHEIKRSVIIAPISPLKKKIKILYTQHSNYMRHIVTSYVIMAIGSSSLPDDRL